MRTPTSQSLPESEGGLPPGLLARRPILIDANLPCRPQSSGQHVFPSRRQPNVGSAVPPPSAVNRQEQLRSFFDECSLLFRREHQIAVPLALRRQRGENPAAYSKVRRAHVGALFGAFQVQRDPSKIVRIHTPYFFTGDPIHQVIPQESTTPALRWPYGLSSGALSEAAPAASAFS